MSGLGLTEWCLDSNDDVVQVYNDHKKCNYHSFEWFFYFQSLITCSTKQCNCVRWVSIFQYAKIGIGC